MGVPFKIGELASFLYGTIPDISPQEQYNRSNKGIAMLPKQSQVGDKNSSGQPGSRTVSQFVLASR